MGLATRQRSFQRALSVSAYNRMDWRLQKRKCLGIEGDVLGLDPQTSSLKPLDHQTKEKLPSQGVLRPPEALQEANPWIWPT